MLVFNVLASERGVAWPMRHGEPLEVILDDDMPSPEKYEQNKLTRSERAELAEHEAYILNNQPVVLEMAYRAYLIKSKRLYREKYGTWEAYCEEVLGITPEAGHRLALTGRRKENVTRGLHRKGLGNDFPRPRTGRQMRALTGVPDEEQVDVWVLAVKQNEGRQPSGQLIEGVVLELYETPESQPSAKVTPEVTGVSAATTYGFDAARARAKREAALESLTEAEKKILQNVGPPVAVSEIEMDEYPCYSCGNWFWADQLSSLQGNRFCIGCKKKIEEATREQVQKQDLEHAPEYQHELDLNGAPEQPAPAEELVASNGEARTETRPISPKEIHFRAEPEEMLDLIETLGEVIPELPDIRTHGLKVQTLRLFSLLRKYVVARLAT